MIEEHISSSSYLLCLGFFALFNIFFTFFTVNEEKQILNSWSIINAHYWAADGADGADGPVDGGSKQQQIKQFPHTAEKVSRRLWCGTQEQDAGGGGLVLHCVGKDCCVRYSPGGRRDNTEPGA